MLSEEQGRKAYEHWCELKRIAPPLVLDWDELSDKQRGPFLTDYAAIHAVADVGSSTP